MTIEAASGFGSGLFVSAVGLDVRVRFDHFCLTFWEGCQGNAEEPMPSGDREADRSAREAAAREAIERIRQRASETGLDQISVEEIDEEIRLAREARGRTRAFADGSGVVSHP